MTMAKREERVTPKQESESLLDEMLPFAKHLLGSYGEFHPFGGLIKEDEQIILLGAGAGEDFPARRDLVNLLSDGFRERALTGDIRAAAIVAQVTVPLSGKGEKPEKVDAVRISLDHHDGYAVHVFFPYRKDGARVTFAEPFAAPGTSFAFRGEAFPV
jgi:hypothetical protein